MSAREDAYAAINSRDGCGWMLIAGCVRMSRAFLAPSAAASVYCGVERKYSPNQPRVPAGNGRESGRWTEGSGGGAGSGANLAASPMGHIDFGDLPNFSDVFSLFQITPGETDNSDYTQLAGDVSEDGGPDIGRNEGSPLEPPEIPQTRPNVSDERMSVVWDVVEWIGKKGRNSPAVSGYFGILNAAHWFKYYEEMTKTYHDPPETLEQLQHNAQKPSEAGYHDHHIEEQTLLERLGFSRSE